MKSLLAAFLLLASAASALAQTPNLLSYQARVTDSSGVAIGNSGPVNRTVTFKFYDASSGGTLLYAESQTVTISGGEFSVLIGNGTGLSGLPGPSAPATVTSLSSIFTGPAYLGLTVDDGTAAADPEISPRQQIVSGAYAFRAKVAETVASGALTTSMLADSNVTKDKIASSAVGTSRIADYVPGVSDTGITTAKLVDGNITTAKIADGNVTTIKIADSSVTTAKIADAGPAGNGITTAKIVDGAVTTAKIADNSITSLDIQDGTIATADIADAVAAGTGITTAKIAANAVDYGKLVAAVQQALCPTGTITAFAGDTAPAGWLLCDGALLSKSSYPALSGLIGTRFGGDTNNFRVPDFRGRFLRGRANGSTLDPDRASRTAMATGGATGDAVGSVQDDEFERHNHALPRDTGGNENLKTVTDTSNSDESIQEEAPSGYRGGSETRPKNAYVNYIIKL